MDRKDRDAIDELFEKLRAVEARNPERDREAEALIRDYIARQPGAPYYMAQAVIALEQALAAAQERLEEAEQQRSGGGFLEEIFGSRRPGPTSRRHGRLAAGMADGESRRGGASPRGYPPSFLGGAMQTALGVAGGVVLGSFMADLLMPDAAAAQPAYPEGATAAEDASGDDFSGGADLGGGDFDFGGDI